MLALLCLITGVSLRNYPSGINIFFKYNRASFMQYVTLAQVVKNALYFYILYIGILYPKWKLLQPYSILRSLHPWMQAIHGCRLYACALLKREYYTVIAHLGNWLIMELQQNLDFCFSITVQVNFCQKKIPNICHIKVH